VNAPAPPTTAAALSVADRALGRCYAAHVLSRTAEYALRAMVYLAKRDGESISIREIADAAGVPQSYLSKIMHGIARANLVLSQRGKNGGFTLAREPAALTLFDIVQAVDPIHRITECPRGVEEHCDRLCPLHTFLDQQIAHLHESFRGQTIAMLMSGSPAVFPDG
jgi:Rrf2 family nitric oxide-sensitive transcriptional repressor